MRGGEEHGLGRGEEGDLAGFQPKDHHEEHHDAPHGAHVLCARGSHEHPEVASPHGDLIGLVPHVCMKW